MGINFDTIYLTQILVCIHSLKVGGYYTWDKRYLIVVIYVNTYTVDLVCKVFCRE